MAMLNNQMVDDFPIKTKPPVNSGILAAMFDYHRATGLNLNPWPLQGANKCI